MTRPPAWILPTIIVSQFAGSSVWFAGNAVVGDLQRSWGLAADALGHITSAVQLGFIAGTLVFAFLAIADRYSPRKTFLACSVLGAVFNGAPYVAQGELWTLLGLRFLTGVCLAGIYPVGMKIASGWYRDSLGRALGFLVGALVLGTAFPHLIRGLDQSLPWQTVLLAASGACLVGGILMFLLVPDGPYLTRGARFDPTAFAAIFRSSGFRASAFGYFGHMWELYAFWAFVPLLLAAHADRVGTSLNVSTWTFAVIGAGAIGSVVGGLVSGRVGSGRVAFAQLAASGLCCALAPVLFHAPQPLFLAYLLFWGVVVVGDSPQLSALNAHHAPPRLVGSALTIANSIGFAITIASLQLLTAVSALAAPQLLFLLLVPGPALGLLALRRLVSPPPPRLEG